MPRFKDGIEQRSGTIELTAADKNDLTLQQNELLGQLVAEIRKLNMHIAITYDIDDAGDIEKG